MIWDRGYYSSKDDPHTFTHKAWAAAEIAGIVSIGFAALPMIGGAATAQFGKFLATEKGNSLLGVVGTEFSEVFKKTASEASQFFGTATKEIRSSAYTTLTHQKRARAYRDVLAPLIEGYNASDHEKFVSKLKGLIPSFSPIIGAVDMQAVEHINPQEYLSALEKKAAKLDIVFKSDFKRKQQEIFRSLINAGRDKNASQEEVDHFLMQNHAKVAQSLKDAWTRTVEARERALIKSKNIPGRSLTWGEINKSKKLQGKMDTYLNTMGYKGGYTGMYNEVMHNIQDLFAETRTKNRNKVHKWNEPIVDELVDLFHSTHSGYSLGADGRIISTAHVSNTARHLVEKGFSHLQLPLIPYKFNVPVRLFKFAQTEHKAVIHLGNIEGQAELSKAFKHSINSVQSHGVALGEHLLIMDPDAGSIIDTGHKIATYKSRNSAAIQRMAGLRSLDAENYLKNPKAWLNNIKPDSKINSELQRQLYATSPSWMDLDYDPSVGFIGKPKIQEYSVLYQLTHGKSVALDVTKIHPDQLSHLLKTNKNITPGDQLLALDRIMIEKSRSSENIGHFLADNVKVVENVTASSSHYPWKDYRGLLHSVYERAGNAKDLAEAVAGIPDNAGFPGEPFSLLEAATRRADQDRWYSPLHQLNSKLWRAVTSFASEPEQISEAAKLKNGFFGELRQEIEGKTGISPMFQKLQEGLLSQWIAEASYTTLENSETGSRHIMAQIQDGIGGSLDSDTVIGKAIARLGLSTEQTKNFLGQVYNGKYVDFNKLNAVLGTLVDPQELLSLTTDPLVKAKIADELRYSVEESMAVLGEGHEHRKAQLVTTIAEHAKLLEKIGGKGAWFPQDMPENVLNQPMYFAVPNETPSFGEVFENPLKVLREQFGKGFGLGEYFEALVNPDHPLGQFSMATTILMQMPQEIANNIGIGLGQQDRITAARSLLGFYGKRVAPLVGAYAAYQGLNHLAHRADMPGVDDIGANMLANVNLAGATVKDALGITKASKYLVGLLPGLDQYFHPRSHDEYEDYLFYGDEEVRSGRGWVIGSRGSIHGGKIKYVRPNFYRRWKSHWTEVDNSFSYSPHNPYVQHAQHRKELNNLRDENYLEINSQGQYGELGYGTFGYGLPIQTSGGGTPVLFGEVGGYPGGAGSTGPGGAHPGGLPIRLNYFHGHSEGSMSLQNLITGASDIFRRQFGLYGTLLQRVPFFPTEYDSTARQNPNADHNIIRRMFAGDYGEATGPLGEFLRRFVNYRQQPYDAPSNLINDMPSWLPERFHTGNAYLRTPAGEHNLPGEAWEREHPYDEPLRVRGSNIGLTEKEIIQKWLNPMQPLEGDGAEDIVGFGSEAHLKIQRQLRDQGILVGAEVSIFDKEHNISGTIDAIVRGPTGNEIFDIKTQGAKSWGHTPDKYIDQITAYMAITGLKMAHLAFVNRDDMSQVRIEDYPFDPHRWQNILDKVDRARAVMNKLVEKGTVSKYETYDLLSRIEILARVAPKSQEFRDAVQFAEESGGFGGFEKQRFQAALRTAGKLSEDYNLYPNRYSPKLETHSAMVLGVNSDGSVTTDIGTFKMAGVKWDNQAFAIKDPETIMKEYGIVVGKKHKMTLLEGQWNPELTNDTNLPAIFGSANARLINSDYADRDSEARDPLSGRVLFGEPIFGKIAENLLHRDNIFCIDPETRILTQRGEVKAKNLTLSDKVYTHKGRLKKITGIKTAPTKEKVYEIVTMGSNIPFIVTGNHRVLACVAERSGAWKSRTTGEQLTPLGINPKVEFVEVQNLKSYDYMAYKPREFKNTEVFPTVSMPDLDSKRFLQDEKGVYTKCANSTKWYLTNPYIQITPEIARLFGYYAAEGSIARKKNGTPMAIIFTFHANEKKYIEDVNKILKNLNLNPNIKYKDNTARITVNSIELALLLDREIGVCHDKRGPEVLCSKKLRAEFIKGLFRGDGPKTTKVSYSTLTLRATNLLLWVRDCLADLWGIPTGVSRAVNVGEFKGYILNIGEIEDFAQFIDNEQEYVSMLFSRNRGTSRCWKRDIVDGYLVTRIQSIKEIDYEGKVVDISVQDDETFSTILYTIHNSNKFLRIRNATEQLERGEIYGTDDTSWSHMWDTFGGPTLSAIASKNPFEGALMGAAIAGMFITGSKEYKKWAGIAGAVAGGSLATLKSFYDLVHHDEWVPSRVKKRRMHDEYWDLIKFVKFSTIANAAKKKAKRLEGIDIDQLEDAEKRTTVGLGPWAILALNAEKKAMGTMYAFDPDSGSLDEALSAIPDRHKQLARSVILNGSRREKERFYSLLSNPEKRTLGKFIGVNERDLPIRPRMSKYFQKHFLPGPFWQGWDPAVELDDIEDRAAEMEGQKIDRPSRARTERARDHTKNVMIPRMDRGTGFLIGGRLEAITALAGKNLRVKYDIKASDTNVVNVNMHLFEDQTDQLIAEMKKDAWSS